MADHQFLERMNKEESLQRYPHMTADDKMAATKDIEDFRYKFSQDTYNSFESGNGFGPFTVERRALRDEILSVASPIVSVHVSGGKGAG